MQSKNYKQTLINFLNENITAARLCLENSPTKGKGYSDNDVLGFPAAMLIFSVIDAIGTIKLESSKAFEILGTEIFGNLNIDNSTAQDLYQAYRNPFFHNNILVEGRILLKGNGNGNPFYIKNNKVVAIELMALLKKCEEAIEKFELSTTEEDILNNSQIQKHIKSSSINNRTTNDGYNSSIIAM